MQWVRCRKWDCAFGNKRASHYNIRNCGTLQFRMADYDEIMQSPAMFTRKFSMQTDPEIVKAIQAKIEEKNYAK